MQYFRNTPRCAMDYQNPRSSDIFPLCRNDRDDRANSTNERQGRCSCAVNTRSGENNRERISSCGCANQNRASENERTDRSGCLGNNRSERQNNCGCDRTSRSEDYGCTGLAMAFVPEQEFTELNDADEALCRGTLFRQLDMPFYGQRRRNCK